jgi:hypothetical protein
MTLQALRNEVGDTAFFKTLRTGYAGNRYGNDHRGLHRARGADQRKHLDALFEAWLLQEGRPAACDA